MACVEFLKDGRLDVEAIVAFFVYKERIQAVLVKGRMRGQQSEGKHSIVLDMFECVRAGCCICCAMLMSSALSHFI